jgi:hypothetical protein
MPDLSRIEPKLRHCGPLSRILRHEHAAASLGVGESVHHELRRNLSSSFMVRGWAIDGQVNALAGAIGAQLSPFCHVWMAISQRFTRYPKYVVSESRAMLDELMQSKMEIRTTITGDDAAALRFAVHMGFASTETPAAFSHYGRRLVMNCLREDPEVRVPHGTGYAVPMFYDGVAP